MSIQEPTCGNLANLALAQGHFNVVNAMVTMYGLESVRDDVTHSGCTLAHQAVACGNVENIRRVADMFGAEFMCRPNHDGITPGHSAIMFGRDDDAVLVLDALHSISAQTLMGREYDAGFTPMHFCAVYGRVRRLEKLHDLQYQLNDVSTCGLNLAHIACGRGKLEILQLLVNRGAGALLNVAEPVHNWYPIHYAARTGSSLCIKFITDLLGSDACHVKDREGYNIAHIATRNNHWAVLKWLVENGHTSLLHERSNIGTKPIEMLTDGSRNHEQIKDFIQSN